MAKQKAGDIKWLLLESLRGAAAFRVPDISIDEGLDAYGAIFDNAQQAKASKAQYMMRKSVRDFVSGLDISLENKGYLGVPRAGDLLLKAWDLWNRLPPSVTDSKHQINWIPAIEAAKAQDKFIPVIEKALKDAKGTPSLQTLKLGIVVFHYKDSKRAIELLKQAQKRLEPNDFYNQKWLYKTWYDLILRDNAEQNSATQNKSKSSLPKTTLQQLAAMRKDQISYTGTGYEELLKLYWKLGDTDKAQALIKTAQPPGIPQKAIVNIGTTLLSPPRALKFDKTKIQKFQKQGVALLQAYLDSLPKGKGQAQRPAATGTSVGQARRVFSEIRARLALGRYFVKHDDITQALKTLKISGIPKPVPNTEAAMYYQSLVQLKAKLDHKLKGVAGAR